MFSYELPNLELLRSEGGELSTPENEYLLRQLQSLLTQKNNLHGRRVGMAKDAINPGDYVTKRQINGNLFGTLALRPQPANVSPGTTYFATDRNVTYQMRNGHWYYDSGVQYVTLSPDTKPSPSILYDNGYLIYSTDLNWFFRWNLTTWVRLNGTSRYIQGFEVAPTSAGWGLCDGTTYTYSKDDGSTGTVASPNLTSTAKFVQFASVYNASIAAVAPTISGSTGSSGAHTHTTTATGSVTGTLPDHTHGISITSGTGNLSLTGSLSSNAVSVTVNNNGDCVTVMAPVETFDTASVAQCSHNHSASASVDTTTISFGNENHTHAVEGSTAGVNEGAVTLTLTFTGDSVTSSSDGAHTHTGSSLTISATGTPLAVALIPYIRL